MTLEDRLKAQISACGPMSVAEYMTACLHDPEGGYYATRPALGDAGDFITAPLVSQMFGEILGLWAVECWVRLGRPARVLLAEAGPGDGALMSDMLRAARLEPAFLGAAQLFLVETSPALAALQAERLATAPLKPQWLRGVDDLPADAPLILIANELLDCLPARQFQRTAQGWSERMVGLGADGALCFGLSRRPLDRLAPDLPVGSVIELSPAQEAFGAALGARIAGQGGVALLIDYGRDAFEPGDTLQALRRHQKVSPLATPGEADLTVHADFPAVAAAARAAGAKASAIIPQGELLVRLGLGARAGVLAQARPERAQSLQRQFDRLTAPDQMGVLFKALALYSGAEPPPGFESPQADVP